MIAPSEPANSFTSPCSGLRTAIVVGAGPAGLCAAYWLGLRGIRTTVVERAKGLRTGGIPIDLRGAAIDVAKQMGIWEQILAQRTRLNKMRVLRERGRTAIEADFSSIPKDFNQQIELFRGNLVDTLARALPDPCRLVFDEHLSQLEHHADGVNLTFRSGLEMRADIVIGADGQRSTIRRLSKLDKALSHLGAWVAVYTLPNTLDLEHAVESYFKPGRLLSVFTTPDNKEVVVAFLHRDKSFVGSDDLPQDRIRSVFSDYRHRTPELLAAMPTDDTLYFDSISQVKLDHWFVNDRVVLLGDAAWGPSLLSGQGTSMAIVGAFVLVRELLAHHQLKDSLASFRARMLPFVKANQDLARVGLGVVLPASQAAIAIRHQIMRFAPLLARMSSGLDRRVLRAANAIDLKAL